MKSNRARCLYCGKLKPVTASGSIRKHYITGGPTTTQAGKRVVCGGSGRTRRRASAWSAAALGEQREPDAG